MKKPEDTRACEICGADEWTLIYEGPIRDGSFGTVTPEDRRVFGLSTIFNRCKILMCCGPIPFAT